MKIRKLLALLLVVLLLLGLVACNAPLNKMDSNGIANDVVDAAPEGGAYVKEESDTESTPNLPENRKLIQTVHMSVETENLDTVLQQRLYYFVRVLFEIFDHSSFSVQKCS